MPIGADIIFVEEMKSGSKVTDAEHAASKIGLFP